MERGEYLKDGTKLLGFAGQWIKEVMDEADAIQGALFLAIGMEKWLKHGLVLINPTYVLSSPDFKHSASVLYKSRIVSKGSKELESNPSSDVLTFRLTLTRAKVFSEAANNHGNLLFSLPSWRDVIVHRPTCELPLDQVKKMLQKDAVPLVTSFCGELGLTPLDVFGANTRRLVELSERLTNEEMAAQRVETLLEEHRSLWEHRIEKDKGFASKAKDVTQHLLGQSGGNYTYDDVRCPACGNQAVVRIEPQYDIAEGQGYLAGAYVEELHCYYCGLRAEDYETLNLLDVDALLSE